MARAPHETRPGVGLDGPSDFANRHPAVSVTAKVAAILQTIACGELSLSDVARRTGLPHSTAHRLLKELVRGRLLERTTDGRYRPCGTLHRDGGGNHEAMSARAEVCQTLDDLGEATGSRARFGVWSGTRISYIERSAGISRGTCATGLTRLPPHATALGKALLAHASPTLLRRVVGQGLPSYTALTITTVPDLESCLAAVRGNELAVTWGELAPRLGAAATPVRRREDLVVGALELNIDDLRDLPRARACLFVAAPVSAVCMRLGLRPR